MNLSGLKSKLEIYLNTNVTDIAIKWEDLNIYTLDSDTLSDEDVEALELFIAPSLVLISYEKEILSTDEGFENKAFFQIDIYTKTNTGATKRLQIADRLSNLFKEQIIDDVVIENVKLLNKFDMGEYTILPIRFTSKLYSN